jgi:hypothetical protein
MVLCLRRSVCTFTFQLSELVIVVPDFLYGSRCLVGDYRIECTPFTLLSRELCTPLEAGVRRNAEHKSKAAVSCKWGLPHYENEKRTWKDPK